MRYSRKIKFQNIQNSRDLGGYRTPAGYMVAWRSIFRSGDPNNATPGDITKIKEKLKVNTILDLRNDYDIALLKTSPMNTLGFKYFNIPLMIDDPHGRRLGVVMRQTSNLGDVYSFLVRQPEYGRRIVEALQIIADPDNIPLIFHCSAGKDRTGILAAILLGVLGVSEIDIIKDYAQSWPPPQSQITHTNREQKPMQNNISPTVNMYESASESIKRLLSNINREYGSIRDYIKVHGASPALFEKIEKTLLT
jgi:protein-tyrosine phosphatase